MGLKRICQAHEGALAEKGVVADYLAYVILATIAAVIHRRRMMFEPPFADVAAIQRDAASHMRAAALVARKARAAARRTRRAEARKLAQLYPAMVSAIAQLVAERRTATVKEAAKMHRAAKVATTTGVSLPPPPSDVPFGGAARALGICYGGPPASWIPTPLEAADCCADHRLPHPKFPWAFRVHCRSRGHARELVRAAMRGRDVSPDVEWILQGVVAMQLYGVNVATVKEAYNALWAALTVWNERRNER